MDRSRLARRWLSVASYVLAPLTLAPPVEGRPTVTYLGDMRFRIEFRSEDLRQGTVVIDGEQYHTFDFAEAGRLRGEEYVGHPDLPFLSLSAVIPSMTQVLSVDTLSTTVVTLPGTYLPAPIQHDLDPRNPRPPVPPDQEIYGSFRPYPAELGQRAFDGSMRGYHLGVSRVFPIRYIGATRRIQVMTSLDIRLRLGPYDMSRGPLIERSTLRPRNTLTGDEVSWVVRNIANTGDLSVMYPIPIEREQSEIRTPYGGFLPTDRPADAGPPVNYVIITDNTTVDGAEVGDLIAEFQRLADWKTRKGTPAVVRTVNWIHDNYDGDDIQEEIRNFIIDAYKLWGTDWVLLGGDVEVVPDRWFGGNSAGQNDLSASVYYGGLDGTWNTNGDEHYFWDATDQVDPFWDVWVGRIPASGADEAKTVVDKVLKYELVPGIGGAIPDAAYCKKFIAMTGAVNDTTWGSRDCGYYVAEDIIRSMAVPAGLDPVRLYEGILDPSDPNCMSSLKRELFNPPFSNNPIFDAWGSGEAHDYLDDGFGFVYHYEHSTLEFLGGPSRHSDCDAPLGQQGQSVYGEAAARFTNGPKYSVMLSRGSQVNEHELDSVSERFILNPSGGAVAFLGKCRSTEDPASGIVDTLFFKEILRHNVTMLGQAYGFSTQKAMILQPNQAARPLANWNLLGDPEMRVWTDSPKPLVLTFSPVGIGGALPVRIRITVADSISTAPLDSALVCIKQANDAYAFNLTDATGATEFDFHPTNADSSLLVTVSARNHIPKQMSVALSSGGGGGDFHAVYESHEPTEVSGNDNSAIEAGEQWDLKVTTRNIGVTQSVDLMGKLRVIGPVTMTLRVNDIYDPQKIYIGKFGSHPPRSVSVSDTAFTLPALEWRGINAYGRPPQIDSNVTGFFVWRDTMITQAHDWRVLWRESGSSALTKFSGTLVAPGEFTNPTAIGFESGDNLWSSATKLTFQGFSIFSDMDSLLFDARETKWVTVVDSLVHYGVINPGATASGLNGDTFEVKLKPELPDRHSVVFEVVMGNDVSLANTSSSKFMLGTAAPVISQRVQDLSKASGELRLLPTIRNSGSGYADNVMARLAITVDDSLTMVSDEINIGEIPPMDERTPPSPFRFTIAGADTSYSTIRFRLELENSFDGGGSIIVVQEGIDIQRPSAPTLASLDPTPNGLWAVWNHANPPSDLRGYNVYRDNTRVNPAVVESASRFFISDLVPQTPYDIVITTQDKSGNQSKWPTSDVSQTTAPSVASGWPKSLDGHTRGNMSPTVADVDGLEGREVFAASGDVFAWRLNSGMELIDGDSDASTSGVFYKTPDSLKASVEGFEVIWAAPLAVADLDSTPDGFWKEIVGVTSPAPGDESRLVVLNRNGTERWVVPLPRVLPYASPVIANIDTEPKKEILLLANNALYVWNDDGSAYLGNDVRLVTNLPSKLSNSPAVGNITDDVGMEIVIGRVDQKVDVYKSSNGSLAWSFPIPDPHVNCPNLYRVSTPVLGDIDADGKLDVAVTAETVQSPEDSDGVFLIDENGNLIASFVPGHCAFVSDHVLKLAIDGQDLHVAPPSLGNLDQDSRLEIVFSGKWTLPVQDHDFRSEGFVLDLVGSSLNSLAVSDSIPRRHESQPLNVNLPFGQPVLADIDDSGVADGIYTTTLGGIFAFNPSTGSPTNGWPVKVSEAIAGTPVVGSLTNRAKFDLLVLDRGGTLHLFNTAADSTSVVEWPQFGGNSAHTFLYQGGGGGYVAEAPNEALEILGQNIPNPFNPETRIVYRLESRERVVLNVYAASGRMVRSLVNGFVGPGVHEVRWDGRNDNGLPVPSGVFFYELEAGNTRISRKMLLLR